MEPVDQHVVVHLVGHHDLYFEFAHRGRPVLALHTSHACYSAGKAALAALASPEPPRIEGDRVVLGAPSPIAWKERQFDERLEWRTPEVTPTDVASAPLVAIRIPLLSATLARVRMEAREGQRIALVLASSGDTRETPGRGPSTQNVAAALAAILARTELGAGITVIHRHFDTPTAHRFDGLPAFLRGLWGDLAGFRRVVVAHRGPDWAKHFRVSLSVNTGPTPLITGLVRGTEEFAPRMIVIGDARRWPERDGVPLTFEATFLDTDAFRQRPAAPADTFAHDTVVTCAIDAMRAWRMDYAAARPRRAGDLAQLGAAGAEANFWFRKGTQEVLALLVVRDPETRELRTFRGLNLEVSLPTGTLCAERNAIGSAVAALPTLERRDIEAVAVLGLKGSPRLGPCGACSEWLRKMSEANPDLRVITFEDTGCEQVFVDPVC